MPTEGQIAIGPNGEQAVFTGGQWVVMAQAGPPIDPGFQYEGAQAAANVANTQSTIAARQSADARAAEELDIRRRADARAEREFASKFNADGTPKGAPVSATQRAEWQGNLNNIRYLEGTLKDLRARYERDFRGKGLQSIAESYAPAGLAPQYAVFDDLAGTMLADMAKAKGLTAQQFNTPAEQRMFFEPLIPRRGDTDEQIEVKLDNLERMVASGRQMTEANLGIAPTRQRDDDPLNAMAVNRIAGGGGGGGAAGFGAESTGGGPLPPEMQAEYSAWLRQNLNNFDPAAYADFRTALDQKYGFPADRQMHLDWATATKARLDQGGATLGDVIPAPERELSETEQFRNNLVSNPLGAAAVGAADMGSFGAVGALAPEAYAALQDARPVATGLGQIAGGIVGAGALGRASAALAGRAAPNLLGGGARAAAARGIGTDAAYSGIYGAVSGDDPLASAALGGVGSVAGRAVGRGLGAAVGGGRLSAAAQALQDRGVPLTVGRRLGETASRIEDRAASLPIVGDMIRRRQTEAFEGFNRAAFEEAGRPIGVQVNEIGEAGVNGLRQAVGDAYTNATRGLRTSLDEQFINEINAVRRSAEALPPDLGGKLEQALTNRIDPIINNAPSRAMSEPSLLSTPRTPTPDEMARFSAPQSVPLAQVRRGNRLDWDRFNRGEYGEPLVPGYADKPIAVMQENGEYIILDGNHRAARAFESGLSDMEMSVIRARDYDPSNAGRAPTSNPSSDELDALLAELGGMDVSAAPAAPIGELTGRSYQQAMRGLKSYKAEATKPGFEQDYRDALGRAMDALRGQAQRGGGQGVIDGLGRSDATYRNMKILENASLDRARIGTRTGEVGVFAPSQLVDAARAAERKYPGANPLKELGEAGQRVLPATVPNSGTADRLMQAGLGTAILGGSAGADAYTGSSTLTPLAAALLALGTAGGTRVGQNMLGNIINTRPAAARAFGEGISRRRGLFGSGATGLTLGLAN